MTLYGSFLSMAPFILLAVTASAFGPWGRGNKKWSYTFLWDAAMVSSVIAGGVVSVLVLGDVVSPSDTTRRLVVVAGCVSLGLLATHMLGSLMSLYRARGDDLADEETPPVDERAGAHGPVVTASHEGAGRPTEAGLDNRSDPRKGVSGTVASGAVRHTE